MKIVVLTAYTENIRELSDLSYASISKYAKKHNIPCVRVLLENCERPPSWYKIPLILEQFDLGFDYVAWVDADTTVVNYEYELSSILDDSFVYLSRDINNFNCGVMIWRRDAFTYTMLRYLWSMTAFISHAWWEQAAFINLYESDYNGIQSIPSKIKVIPQYEFNSYDYSLYGMEYPQGQTTDKSWIIHFPGLSNEKRIQLIKQYNLKYDTTN
jgi:hypothetical protein